ncbi:MAG: hypothetical protein ACRD68_14160, partial [Pyrinomonadaceae bacterium]
MPASSRGSHRARPVNENPSWRERVAALRYVPPLIKLVWRTHRGFTAAMIALRLVRSFVPLATLWVGKLIIDAVVSAATAPGGGARDLTRLWELVALEVGVVLAGEVLARASALVE